MIMKYKDFKILAINELKRIVGGDEQLSGCYIKCMLCPEYSPTPGTACNNVATMPIDSCQGASSANCMGWYFVNCNCYNGPYV